MSEKVIFLDFDGPLSNPRVILSLGNDSAFDPVAVSALNNLCEATGVKIVCSSTRTLAGHEKNFQETKYLLGQAGLDPRHLHEDWCCFYSAKTSRKAHIRQWLAKHPEVTHYAIIDDERVRLPNLVRVTEMDGLLVRHFEKLAKILDFNVMDIFNKARQRHSVRKQPSATPKPEQS